MGVVADVQTYLEAQGIIGGATGWKSLRRAIVDGPGDDSFDQLVSIREDGGFAAEVKAAEGIGDAAIGRPAVLLTVRAKKADGDASGAKAQEIFSALNSFIGTMGVGYYLVVNARTSGPVFAGFDERGRPLHTIGFVLMMSL